MGSEYSRRRLGWTEGTPVTLSDGTIWYFPVVNLPLIVTSHVFRRKLAKVVAQATSLRDGETIRGETIQAAYLHASMAEIAVRLLGVNYDLPDATWMALLRFEDLRGMLVLTAQTMLIVAQACKDWGPLIATARPDAIEACSLN